MIRLTFFLGIAIILSSCTNMRNVSYTDDLYYIPESQNQTIETNYESQTTIVNDKKDLNYKKNESYDGFADSYNEQESGYEESYVVVDYSNRLRRFHGVYVYDPYYLLDPWYNNSWGYYGSYGYGYSPHIGFGWNSYGGFNMGFGYNWHNPWYGNYYPWGGSYWAGFNDGYWAGNYTNTNYYGNHYTSYYSHRGGANQYAATKRTGSGVVQKTRITTTSTSQSTLTREGSASNGKKQFGTGAQSSLTRESTNSSSKGTSSANSSITSSALTRPMTGSSSKPSKSHYNLDHSLQRNISVINNNKSIQPSSSKNLTRTRYQNNNQLNSGRNINGNANYNTRRTIERTTNSPTRTNNSSRTIRSNVRSTPSYSPSRTSGSSGSSVKSSSPTRTRSSGSSSTKSSGGSSSPRRR